MKRNTLLTLCAIAALGATTALGIVKATPVAPAAMLSTCTFEWDGSTDTVYRDATNWTVTAGGCTTDTDIPNSADHKVVIKNQTNQPTLDLNGGDITMGELVIESSATFTVKTTSTSNDLLLTRAGTENGKLTIQSSATLDVSTGGVFVMVSAVTHEIAGELLLSMSDSDLEINDDVTVNGYGSPFAALGFVKGQNDTAKIIIADGKTLTNNIKIMGQMRINGPGTFLNGSTGIVRANGTASAPAVLLLASNLIIDDADTGTPKWEATTDPDAVLQFDVGATCLDGNFLIGDCAKIQLNGVSIDTRGSYTNSGGLLDLVGAVHFGHSCDAGCNNCTTISSDDCVTGAPSCDCS